VQSPASRTYTFREWRRAAAAALCCALAALAPVRAAAADLALGPRVGAVALGLRLEVVAEPAAPSPPFSWRREGAALVGAAEDARMRATVRAAEAEPGRVELRFAVEWRVAALVEREAIVLRLPAVAHALGRDLRFAPLVAPLRVDRGTPIVAAGGGLVLAGGPGFVAARYAPTRSGGVEVRLLADDAGAHPFAVYTTCLERLPGLAEGAPISFASLEKKRFLGRTARRAGDRVEAVASLYAVNGDAAPLYVERWPGGARAALVFTDHADRTDPDALRAVLYGSSDPAAPGYGKAGFLGRGVRLTKSFFVRARRGGLEGDPEARALAEALRAAGSEVASHSVSGGADDRDAVRAGLATLRAFGVTTWIDHEPYTNCEAISSEGWRTEGRYGIRDLLVEGGMRWVWEAGDVGGFRAPELVDVFSASRAADPDPPIYPLPIDPRLWVFQSTMFYAPPTELAAAMSDAALDRLEAREGLFVGHTYLSASARTTTRPEHLARLAVRRGPGPSLVIDPALDAALARVAARASAGHLASLTWSEAGDRLRALADVEVRYRADGAALVTSRAAATVRGLTLAAPLDAELSDDAGRIRGRDREGLRARAWLDLAPGETVVVRAARRGATVPFLRLSPGATLAP
jgi:hypothetical protein